MAVGSDLIAQPLGHGLKNRIALGMAEGVVDRLETVEVEEHDGARHIASSRLAQRLAQQLADAAAVGQARQHVHIGKVGQPLLRLANLGDVAADAPKSLEPARPCRRSGRPQSKSSEGRARSAAPSPGVGKRLLFKQHPAKLGMSAEQRGKRMAEQRARRAAQQCGHPAGYVGYAILAIDLPQPAHAALLIFLQQQAGAFRLRAEVGIGLELAEGPPRDGKDADDGDAQREQDRQHIVERRPNCRPTSKRIARRGGKDRHPCGDAGGNDDQAERRDAEARDQRRRNRLALPARST